MDQQQKNKDSSNSTIRIFGSSDLHQQVNRSSSSSKSVVRKVPWDISSTLFGWKCPPKIVLNSRWQVAAGEESKEVEVQKKREPRVLEADYTRYMPRNPFVSNATRSEWYDDCKTPVIPTEPESTSSNYENQSVDESVLEMISKLRGEEQIAASALLASLAAVLQTEYQCDPDEVFRFLGKAETTAKLIEAYRLQARPESTPATGALTCSSSGNVSAQASPSQVSAGVLNDQERQRALVRTYGGLNPSTSNSSVEVVSKGITDCNVVQPMTPLACPSTRFNETSTAAGAVQAGPSSIFSPATSWRSPFPFPPPVAIPPQMDLTSLISHYLEQHGFPFQNVAPIIQNPVNPHYIRPAGNPVPNAPPAMWRPNYPISGIHFNVPRPPLSGPHRPYMGDGQAMEDPAVKRTKYFRPPGQQ